MNKDEIHISYFYRMFQKKYCEKLYNINKSRIKDDIDDDIFECLNSESLSIDEQLSIYNESLVDICTEYITISNSNISIISNNQFELIDEILEENHNNPYKKSFLYSLQFIYRDYFNLLQIGDPILSASEDETYSSAFIMTLDSQYKIMEFEAVNMDLEEETKIMSDIFKVNYNHQLGPYHPKVNIKVRKDI